MRALVQLLMVLYYPFLVAVCVVAAAIAWFFIDLGLKVGGRPGAVLMLPGLFFGLTLLQILVSARALFHPPPPHEEIDVPPEALAGLMKLTRRIAADHKLPAPDVLRLTADDVAHVYEDAERRKVLVIGAPALGILSRQQLAGVIAHELGHFAAGDTGLLRVGFRWRLMMAALDGEFDESQWAAANPLAWLVRGYHLLFHWAWAANSREAEYRADQHSVEHAGQRDTARTLILLEAIDKLPWARLSAIADAAVQLNIPLDRIFTEQATRAAQITSADWQEACARALRRRTGAFDSHPALRERLRAIGVSRKKALALVARLDHSGSKARELITDWDSIEQWLSAILIQQHHEHWEAKQDAAAIVLGRPLGGR